MIEEMMRIRKENKPKEEVKDDVPENEIEALKEILIKDVESNL